MSERRDRRRLHARARALGVSVEQVPRRDASTPRRSRPFAAPSDEGPRWEETETPYRELPASDDDTTDRYDRYSPDDSATSRFRNLSCCQAVLTRRVLDGGTIVMLTTHLVDCPVWSTNPSAARQER